MPRAVDLLRVHLYCVRPYPVPGTPISVDPGTAWSRVASAAGPVGVSADYVAKFIKLVAPQHLLVWKRSPDLDTDR